MATVEERLAALEQEHAELKQKIELQTIAIGGLVSKALLERLNEKHDQIFKALENHNTFTSIQLAELREKIEVQVEGKIAGMQTEVRQRFVQVDQRFDRMDQRFDRMDQRFDQVIALITKQNS